MKNLSILLFMAAAAYGQKFYSDDPLESEPPPISIKEAKNRKLSDYYDLLSHQFGKVGERQPEKGPPIRARGVNTLGEPLQGAWWQKRHYYRRMTLDQLKQGPDPTGLPSTSGKWTVVSAKNEGVTPGFVIIDADKRRFFIKFDPLSNPEMATAADAITSRFFYAMGYYVPENNIIHFQADQLELGADVQLPDKSGRPRQMTRKDLLEILLKVPKNKEGLYRATASAAITGKPVGPPRYYGTRSDDPNDIVLHEHRRDMRALHVIDAWVDHDDSRAINNFDSLVTEGGRSFIRHYQLDFGSTLGSGTQKANSPRSGNPFFSWKDSGTQLFTLGLAVQPWARADYKDFRSIGRFEWKVFDPEKWLPEYPNPAFRNRLPDDEFWGAKLVTAFTDDEIRAIVSTGQLTDKAAEAWLIECLIARRDKVGKAYFSKLLPLDKFRVEAGQLAWDDLGASHKYMPAADVTFQWATFNNSNGTKVDIPGANTARVPSLASGYSVLTIQSKAKASQKIEVYLLHAASGPRPVGLERYW